MNWTFFFIGLALMAIGCFLIKDIFVAIAIFLVIVGFYFVMRGVK